MAPYILLVDNDTKHLEIFQRRLRYRGYEIACATSGYDALQSVKDRLPDLVILDIYMPGMPGLEVCEQLKKNPRSQNVPILILTAGATDHFEAEFLSSGANDYLRKTGDKKVFLERVKKLIDAHKHRLPKACAFSLDLSDSMQYGLSGGIARRSKPVPLPIDRAKENDRVAFIGRRTYAYHEEWRRRLGTGRYKDILEEEKYLNLRSEWRPQAIEQGRELFDKLFLNNGLLMEDWGKIQQAVGLVYERLTLRLGGPRENLALPYELLQDNTGPLIMRYPMSRRLDGIATEKPSWRSTLQQAQGHSLSALIIAGYAGAIDEAQIVARKLKEALAKFDIELAVDPPDLSKSLTFSETETWLKESTHQIIHYAGHSAFDFDRPENSCLLLLDDKQVERKITTTLLHNLLVRSQAQFVFLSSCSGAEISSSAILKSNTYLGLLHAVIQAGVPAALGYRWPVVGRSAHLFTSYFYDGLICHPTSLEYAAWYARRKISEANGWDETWFSPMLIIQNPD